MANRFGKGSLVLTLALAAGCVPSGKPASLEKIEPDMPATSVGQRAEPQVTLSHETLNDGRRVYSIKIAPGCVKPGVYMVAGEHSSYCDILGNTDYHKGDMLRLVEIPSKQKEYEAERAAESQILPLPEEYMPAPAMPGKLEPVSN